MGFKINNASILLTGKIMQWNIWGRYIVWFWISKIGVVLAFRLTTINWISIQNIISKYHNRDGQDLWSETGQNTQLDVSYTCSSLLLVIPKIQKHQSVQSMKSVSKKLSSFMQFLVHRSTESRIVSLYLEYMKAVTLNKSPINHHASNQMLFYSAVLNQKSIIYSALHFSIYYHT